MRRHFPFALLSTCAAMALAAPGFAADGAAVVADVCTSCHVPRADGTLPRIDEGRRTPEAWDMTVVRMMRNHQVALTEEERVAVVRYLSDTRGLSVAETEGYRYILEREPVATDTGPNDLMTQTCGRCHSYSRVALQRRTAEDWEKLLHFHLGQYPSLEYQALARDRDWWGIAQTEVLKTLTESYVMGTAPAAANTDLSGTWQVAGRQPGRGDYHGTLTLAAAGQDYTVTMALTFADASTTTFTGTGLLLGAGEWRATLSDGATDIRQVFALGGDGSLSGRWFEVDRDKIGGRLRAVKSDAAAQILSVSPAQLKAGATAEVTITGLGLAGDPVLPAGVSGEVVSQDETRVVLRLTAAADAVIGAQDLGIGSLSLPGALVVYDKIDRVAVVPELTFSRIGDNGGPIPKVPAQFEAVGFAHGPDGQPETADDLLIGVVPATWRTEDYDAAAVEMQDAKFAGQIDANGLFEPGDAGPNPDRPMNTNNAGNLWVVATVTDGAQVLEGKAHLYATVQRFVDTPIR